MNNGYKSVSGLYICTESYTVQDDQILINISENKFNLEYNIHKTTNRNRIYILSSSKDKLLELVKLYLLNQFYYKFNI